ncbi:MAG: hypothetical protein WAU05_08380, partial [Nitrospira sp.]
PQSHSHRLSGHISWPKQRMSFEPHDYLRHISAEAEYLLDQRRTLTYERNVLGTQMTVLASNTARQSSGITLQQG